MKFSNFMVFHPILLLCCAFGLYANEPPDYCCQHKTVGDYSYTLTEGPHNNGYPPDCEDRCTYTRDDLYQSPRYCFKPGPLHATCDPYEKKYRQGRCYNVVTRKKWKDFFSLPSSEIEALKEALEKTQNLDYDYDSSRSYATIAGYHGASDVKNGMCNRNQNGPGIGSLPTCWFRTCFPCCKPHVATNQPTVDNDNFVTWHRLFLVQMEWAMRQVGFTGGIPYWDWTQTDVLPEEFWLKARVPFGRSSLDRLPTSCDPMSDETHRKKHIWFSPSAMANLVRVAFAETTFSAFNKQIRKPHDQIHMAVGCDMGTVEYAAFDPIFYMHHSYVDFQFAFWQALQDIRCRYKYCYRNNWPLEVPLEPFNRATNPNAITHDNDKGIDTFDYQAKFCYRYDLKFDDQTPEQYLKTYQEKQKNDIVFVGISLRKTGITSQQTVVYCYPPPNCGTANFSTFARYKDPVFEEKISDPYVIRYEITDPQLVSNYDKIIPEVTAYKSANGTDLPLDKTYQPFIIRRPGDNETDSDGLLELHIHIKDDATLADRIYTNPAFKAFFYRDNKVIGEKTFHYENETYTIPTTEKQITFGYDKYYKCVPIPYEYGEIAMPTTSGVTILQTTENGWLENGKHINASRPFPICQGDILLIVWCTGDPEIVKCKDKKDYEDCNCNPYGYPQPGPSSIAVNTGRPGLQYFASAIKKECEKGRKITVDVKPSYDYYCRY